MFRFLLVLLLGYVALAPAAPAQSDAAQDSLLRHAQAEGVRVADKQFIAHYGVTAFMGGLLSVYMVPLALGEDPQDPVSDPETRMAALGVGALAASALLASRLDRTPPPLDREELEGWEPEHQQAFAEAYAKRLRQRRQQAVLWSGVAGGVASIAFMAFVIASMGT